MTRAETEAVCGVVLAGGRSTRMGRDKASLPWRGTTMLGAVVATLRTICDEVIVVAAEGQALPGVRARMVRDPVPDQGPLRALASGLAAAAELGCPRAFVSATDTPMLSTEVLRELWAAPEADIVMASDGERDQPLVALYRTALADDVEDALAAGVRSLWRFARTRTVRRVIASDRAALTNVNTPEEWERTR